MHIQYAANGLGWNETDLRCVRPHSNAKKIIYVRDVRILKKVLTEWFVFHVNNMLYCPYEDVILTECSASGMRSGFNFEQQLDNYYYYSHDQWLRLITLHRSQLRKAGLYILCFYYVMIIL